MLKRAFSLMEMMVVLLITAIVAAASAPMINKKLMHNQAEGTSPWIYTGIDNAIAYNIKNNSAMIASIGDVRTGIAVCDKMQILASPVCVITEKDKEKLAEKIKEIAIERKVEQFCVGVPQNMDGSYGFRSEACREFGELLSENTGIPVAFQNERLTTVSAHNILNAVDVRGKKRKAVVDAVSAVLILEDYMRTV